jgi:putative addiction module CopG family antidote
LSYATIQSSIPSNARCPVGITEKLALPEERTMDPIEACEKLSAEMPNPPEIQHAGDKAFYSPMTALQESVLNGGRYSAAFGRRHSNRIKSYPVLSCKRRRFAMRTTQQFSITLPLDMAKVVERKIKSGAYASVSEVVRDGVRALLERDAAVESWLREEVVPGHKEYLADPSRGVPADAVLERIKARRRATRKAQ